MSNKPRKFLDLKNKDHANVFNKVCSGEITELHPCPHGHDYESQQYEVEAENIEQAEKYVDRLYEEGQVYTEGYLISHIEEEEQ